MEKTAGSMKNVWKSSVTGAGLIILVTIVAYVPSMNGKFLWDDRELVIDNPIVKSHDGLYRAWCTTEAQDYYPLTASLSWMEWRLWADHAVGYHLVNILLHAVSGVLVWMILRRLKIPGAWLAGLIFVVHPVNVATVAWISEQKTLLSMLFYAIAILLFLQFDEDRHWRWYGLSLAAFVLALLSKSAVVMLPVVLLGCVWWRRGRIASKEYWYTVPFFGVSLVLGLTTIWFQQHRALQGEVVFTAGIPGRMVMAGRIPWFYLYKALLPWNLNAVYPRWEIDASDWVSYLPGAILAGGFFLLWSRRNTWGRPLLFGFGYFVVMLFPVLGFFDQGFYRYSLVADHWQYYSIVGVIVLSVVAGKKICRQIGGGSRAVGVVASVLVLLFLGVCCWDRAGIYRDGETLWRDTLAKNPDAWVAHNNLGFALTDAGHFQEALGHFRRQVQLRPGFAGAHYNLATALLRMGNVPGAIQEYEQAIRIKPNYVNAHNNLGSAFLQLGKVSEAIDQFEQALRARPDDAEAHDNLGGALWRIGNVTEAMAHFERALQIKPDFAEAHVNMGLALVKLGRIPDAVAQYEQALRSKPDDVEAHYHLAKALLATGREAEAVRHFERVVQLAPDSAEAHFIQAQASEQAGNVREARGQYEQALRVKPDYPEAQNNLAWLLATLEPADGADPARAVGLAEQACRLTGDRVAPYLDTLAAAYAAAGRFTNAVDTAQKAVVLARSDGQQGVADEIEAHLQLYRGGRAYHRPVGATPAQNP